MQLATVVLYASGYRAAKGGHHWTTISVIPDLLGEEFQEAARYFDSCRIKRHGVDYDRAGTVGEREVAELLREAAWFKEKVLSWLKAQHKELYPQ